MFLRYAVVFSPLLPFLSCSAMPMTTAPDATCNCVTPTAAQISYDKTSSGLQSTNVQTAVDELAGRAAEAPIVPRIYTKFSNVPTTTNVGAGGVLYCDDEAHDLAIGGGCVLTVANPNAAQLGGGLALANLGTVPTGYSCGYQQPTSGGTLAVQIGVICLRNAR